MKAGRELDTLVAAKVMELPVVWAMSAWSNDDWLVSDSPTETETPAIDNPNFKPGNLIPPAWVIPHYSTDIAAAFSVATHVQAVYNVRFSLLVSEQTTVVWARFFDAAADGQKQRRAVRSSTIPHAICMAALKFIGSTFNNPPPKEHAR